MIRLGLGKHNSLDKIISVMVTWWDVPTHLRNRIWPLKPVARDMQQICALWEMAQKCRFHLANGFAGGEWHQWNSDSGQGWVSAVTQSSLGILLSAVQTWTPGTALFHFQLHLSPLSADFGQSVAPLPWPCSRSATHPQVLMEFLS